MYDSGDFELYMMGGGFVKVSSGIQRRILKALQDGDMTATDISVIVGRARSTLTVHLDNLVRDGLVGYRDNPEDGRSKIYYLISDPLIKSKRPDRSALTLSRDILRVSKVMPELSSNLILRSMILMSDGVGLDMAPVMFTIGCNMAEHFTDEITSRSVGRLLDSIKEHFDSFQLGELAVYSKDPITILFRDTIDLTYTTAEVMASFVSGFLVTLLEQNLGKEYRITDQEVFGDRNNYIRMKFEPIQAGL